MIRPKPVLDRWDEQAQQETIAVAQPLIDAINQYNSDQKSPPLTLEQLIPTYLETLPAPTVGSRQWSYMISKRGYELFVESSNPEPPSILYALIFGMGDFDDRYFRYSDTRKVWEMADW